MISLQTKNSYKVKLDEEKSDSEILGNISRAELRSQSDFDHDSTAGVGKLRPAKEKSAAGEHVFFLNAMWPAKDKFLACEH